jgi:hypothetical protein
LRVLSEKKKKKLRIWGGKRRMDTPERVARLELASSARTLHEFVSSSPPSATFGLASGDHADLVIASSGNRIPEEPSEISGVFLAGHLRLTSPALASANLRPLVYSFDPLFPDAIGRYARGEFLLVLDDETRENEGDLIAAAQDCTTEGLGFMIRETSGLVCVGMSRARLDELGVGLMVQENRESFHTAFTVSVDLRPGMLLPAPPAAFLIRQMF